MRIMDSKNTLSDNQTLIFAVGTANTTNSINLSADRDIGRGEPVDVLAQITDDFLSAGAATLQLILETDDNVGFASAETIYDSGAIGKAALVAGYKFNIPYFPRTNQQWVRGRLIIGTADGTAGTILISIGAKGQNNLVNV